MKTLLLFLSSALLLSLSSPGMGLSFCSWFCLVPLLFGCSRIKAKKAALLGFVCGLCYYTYLIYWVVISLGTYGHLPWWLCGIALLLLSAYMALYTAVFCAAASTMKTMTPVWTLPFLWVALDFIRGRLFSGFPWQDLGYSQFKTPLVIQAADLGGHHFITFLIILANCLLFTVLVAGDKKAPWGYRKITFPVVTGFILIAATSIYSLNRYENILESLPLAPKYQITIIQGNIDQNQKWNPEKKREAIYKHINLSNDSLKEDKPDIVIWPETAMPFNPQTHPLFAELLSRTVFQHNYSLLAGAPYFEPGMNGPELYNSAVLVTRDGRESRYLKQHLVPFGEYIPFADILPLPGPLVESVGNFSTGTKAFPLTDGAARLGVLICFESIFPELARKETVNKANILVNITNDAWFGRSPASIQHMSMAVLRAVENRRSLARAANTGISCFIDPAGRISRPTPLFIDCFINGSVSMLDTTSFFTQKGHFFPVLCLIYSFFLLLWIKRSRQ